MSRKAPGNLRAVQSDLRGFFINGLPQNRSFCVDPLGRPEGWIAVGRAPPTILYTQAFGKLEQTRYN